MEQISWPTTASSYVIEAKIGKGAFATVYRAKCSEMDDQLCAIKVLDLDGSSTSSFVGELMQNNSYRRMKLVKSWNLSH